VAVADDDETTLIDRWTAASPTKGRVIAESIDVVVHSVPRACAPSTAT
jgi:hypothetical protein